MADPPPAGCAVCGAGPVEKVLFPVAVHFKGSGFYSTDYGRGSRKASAKETTGDSSGEKGADKAESKATGDSKPSASPD